MSSNIHKKKWKEKKKKKIKETLEREKCTKLYLYIYIFSKKKRSSREKTRWVDQRDDASRENRRIILKKLAREKMRDVF